MNNKKKHLIVGAGITGLLHAWYALKRGEQVIVVDKAKHAGGLIQTKATDYGIVETAANGILNSRLFENICVELNLEIIHANKAAKKRYIYHNQELRRLPLNWLAKIRLFQGIAIRDARVIEKETLAEWGCRILGRQAASALLQPAFGGIYAGNVNHMSAELVLQNRILGKGSMLKQLSLAKKHKKHLRPKHKGMVSLRNGMGSLACGLEDAIKKQTRIEMNVEVCNLDQIKRDYQVDQITLACGSRATLHLLKQKYSEIDDFLGRLQTYNLVTVTRFGREPLIGTKAFGILFPPEKQLRARGVLFNNFIFPDRVEPGFYSETWIYGGAFDNSIVDLDQKAIFNIVAKDRAILNPAGTAPVHQVCHTWPGALPEYGPALLELNKWLDTNLPPDLKVEGNFRNGIGLSHILERAAGTNYSP